MTDKTLEVTQEDREAAKLHQHRFLTEGRSETELLWEALARHRQAAITAHRPLIMAEADNAGYQRAITEAYSAVCGTNADLCQEAGSAYRLCVEAVNRLRVGYPRHD